MSILENTHFEFDFDTIKKKLEEFKKIKKERKFTYDENADYINICDILNTPTGNKKNKRNVLNISKYLDKDIKDFEQYASAIQREYLMTIPAKSGLINTQYQDCYDTKKKELSYDIQEKLLKEFFNFNEVASCMVEYVLNPKNKVLSYKKNNPNFFMEIDKKPLISVDKNNTIDSFLNFVHELGHFYDYLTRSESYNSDYKTLFYDEVFSLFFELKAIVELRNSNIINDDEMNQLFTYYQENNMDGYDYVYIALISDYKYYNLKALFKDLKTKTNKLHYINYYINQLTNLRLKEKIDFCNLEFAFPEISEYNFSYLIALNLLYKSSNMDDALNYLFAINNYLNEDTEKEILSTIYCDKDSVIETVTKHNEEKILKRNN